MANYSKYTRAGAPNLFSHFDRSLKNNANKDIDSSRTHLNYNLVVNNGNQNEILKNRLSEVKCLKRKDVNVLGSWIVTLPKDFKGDEKAFFQATFSFLSGKYGSKNIVSAWVHNDEKQPHLHFSFVPVVFDKKRKLEKVSAKECVTKMDLISFHKDLQNYVSEKLGQEVHILNGATAGGNLTVRQLKVAEQEKDLQETKIGLLEQSLAIERENIRWEQKRQREERLSDIVLDMIKTGDIEKMDRPVLISQIKIISRKLLETIGSLKKWLKLTPAELRSTADMLERSRCRNWEEYQDKKRSRGYGGISYSD